MEADLKAAQFPKTRSQPYAPTLLLRLEGATLLAAAAIWFFSTEGSWQLFVLILLAPDVSMIGYLRGPGLGAVAYNLFHSYPLPALLVALAYLTGTPLVLHVALIWLTHIGLDRLLGFGLKYATGFKDTHLQRV